MRTFRDTKDRTWEVDVNVFTVGRVKALTGVDLQCILENDFALMKQLLSDTLIRGNVLFVLCQRQAENLKVSDEDFGTAFSGQVLTDSAEALVGACGDFFGDPVKTRLLKMMSLLKETVSLMQVEGAEKVDQVLDSLTPSGLAEMLKKQFGAAPASSAFNQDPSLSVSS